MIKLCTKDIFKIDVKNLRKKELLKICKEYERCNDIKFAIYDNSKILKVITYDDLLKNRYIEEFSLIHNESIFIQARDYFYSKVSFDRECIAVTNSCGELMYILQYFENEYYKNGNLTYHNNKFDNYCNCNNNIDLTLLNRVDSYVIMRIEEYTCKIISIILEFFPEKIIYCFDENAKLFFDSDNIRYINSYYDLLQGKSNIKNYMFITSTIAQLKSPIPQYVVNYYNSIEVMTSLYWISNLKISNLGNKNHDKIFFVIDYPTNTAGLVDIIKYVLMHCIFAKVRGYIPIVDLRHFPNQYLINEGNNMWEYYFKQISHYSLEEVYSSENVILLSNNDITIGHMYNPYFTEIESDIYSKSSKKNNYISEMIQFNDDIVKYCNKNIPIEFCSNKRILGVIARGTDFNKESVIYRMGIENVKNASIDKLIHMAKLQMDMFKCDYIYLATEDSENYKKFKEAFRDKLLSTEQRRVTYDKELYKIPISQVINTGNGYEFGKKYLSILWSLSKCNILISSMVCGASLAAQSFNQAKYESVTILN